MEFADSFRAARWIRFINLLLQALLFLALFGGLNYVALNHNTRFDLTRARQHSLSAETKSYLTGLERDVKIWVTLTDDADNPEAAQAFRDISGLLREYTYLTRNSRKGKIEVKYVNVFQERATAASLGLDQPNVVVLASEGHRRVLPLADFYVVKKRISREAFKGESTLTAAILDVTSPGKKIVYFLSGHGEMQPDDVDGVRGLSQLRDELRSRNFEVTRLDLTLSRKIPDDAALVVIAGQVSPVQPFEEELLRNYLQTRAGRIILMIDPVLSKGHGLENLLFDWGVIVYDNVIIDTTSSNLSDTNDLILKNYLPHEITQNLINNDLPLLVGPARVVSEDIGRSADDGLSVKRLVVTSKTAWGETSYRLKIPASPTPGQDLIGQLGVVAISERLKPANNLPLSVRGGRLAVFGTADFVTNNRIINVGNLNLFLATVNWAVDRDTQLNIPARPIQRFQLALTQEELVRLRLGLFLAVPGLVALLGFIVYWTRRN